jgi:hypothetical protein
MQTAFSLIFKDLSRLCLTYAYPDIQSKVELLILMPLAELKLLMPFMAPLLFMPLELLMLMPLVE